MAFPVELKFIEDTERKLGLRFPEPFRRKMQHENGGELSIPPDAWELHPFFDTSEKKRLKRTANHIAKETEVSRGWTGWPDGAVAIGANGSGDRLLFLRSKRDRSVCEVALYWWDHETGAVHLISSDLEKMFASSHE